jgi:hypothetical protein
MWPLLGHTLRDDQTGSSRYRLSGGKNVPLDKPLANSNFPVVTLKLHC